jgi:GH24 family phage-related lysozyme (muramidase)
MTVGWGFNLDRGDGPARLAEVGAVWTSVRYQGAALTQGQADRLLRAEITRALTTAERLVPTLWSHPPEVQCLIIDMAYNLGAAGLADFKVFREAVATCDYAYAAARLRRAPWYRQTGQRARAAVEVLRAAGRANPVR